MQFKKYLIFLFTFICMFPLCSQANTQWVDNKYIHPIYAGLTGGYGQTTWGQLVSDEPNAALSLSTPIHVKEGGFIWGAYAGYEIIPAFAFEASYMHYPDAELEFDPYSIFSFNHDGETELTTHTESVSLIAKIMLLIPHAPGFRAYSFFGAAGVHRNDDIADRWRASPTFGVGFNYVITPRLMVELGTEYVAGYGQSEIEPDEHYVPFLYSGFLRLAYRFGC